MKAAIDGLPGFAAIIRAKCAGRRDRDENAIRITWIDHDAMEAHSACARLPVRPGTVTAQSGELEPCPSAVGRTKQGGIFDAGIDRIRICMRRFEMPYALEFPRMRRAIIPLVRRQRF